MARDFITAWVAGDASRERLLAEEALLLAAAAELERQMQTANVTKSQLAERLGQSKAHVTQVLTGQRNMTLRTLADLAWAMEATVSVHVMPKTAHADWSVARPGSFGFVVATKRLDVDTSAANDVPMQWQSARRELSVAM